MTPSPLPDRITLQWAITKRHGSVYWQTWHSRIIFLNQQSWCWNRDVRFTPTADQSVYSRRMLPLNFLAGRQAVVWLIGMCGAIRLWPLACLNSSWLKCSDLLLQNRCAKKRRKKKVLKMHHEPIIDCVLGGKCRSGCAADDREPATIHAAIVFITLSLRISLRHETAKLLLFSFRVQILNNSAMRTAAWAQSHPRIPLSLL